jgi:hypothetical protein
VNFILIHISKSEKVTLGGGSEVELSDLSNLFQPDDFTVLVPAFYTPQIATARCSFIIDIL